MYANPEVIIRGPGYRVPVPGAHCYPGTRVPGPVYTPGHLYRGRNSYQSRTRYNECHCDEWPDPLQDFARSDSVGNALSATFGGETVLFLQCCHSCHWSKNGTSTGSKKNRTRRTLLPLLDLDQE
eukprot:732995-Rhodomonas_salina.1